jgi:hypothetical protein
LNADTSCGIAVIWTVRAVYRPIADPIRAPEIRTIQPAAVTVPSWMSRMSVAMPAITMPAMDTWLPRRAVAGLFIMCSPITKHAAAST